MLCTAELKKEIDNSRDALLKAIVQSKDRAEIGQRNAIRAKELDKEIDYYEIQNFELKETINYMTKAYKNIEQYLVDKKEESLEMLELAVERAGYIVPDADTEGTHLSIKEKSAKVLNAKGQDINLREGSAYRTVMGMLMRYTLIKFQPDCLQLILLDEAFSTLSDATSIMMREALQRFSKDVLIVGIEQRNVLFEGLDKITYKVVKGENKKTVIMRE